MASPKRTAWSLLAALILASILAPSSFAAGAVAMQVEQLVRQAVAEYNNAMEEGDSTAFVKYFTSNARYESPLVRYSGRTDLARHFDAEFKAYKARFQVNRMFVQENWAAIVMSWEAVDRNSNDEIKIDMVDLFEVGSSGQFSSATLYFDSTKAKALANLGK